MKGPYVKSSPAKDRSFESPLKWSRKDKGRNWKLNILLVEPKRARTWEAQRQPIASSPENPRYQSQHLTPTPHNPHKLGSKSAQWPVRGQTLTWQRQGLAPTSQPKPAPCTLSCCVCGSCSESRSQVPSLTKAPAIQLHDVCTWDHHVVPFKYVTILFVNGTSTELEKSAQRCTLWVCAFYYKL